MANKNPHVPTAEQLAKRYGQWGNHSSYPRTDWEEEVRSQSTGRSYWEWVASQIEQEQDERQSSGFTELSAGNLADGIEVELLTAKEPAVKTLSDKDLARIVENRGTSPAGESSIMRRYTAMARFLKGIMAILCSAKKADQISVKLRYQGKLGDYRTTAEFTGDPGIYEELRVGIFDLQGECVGDALFTLTEEGEPRVLLTTEGNGNDDHNLVWFPLREAGNGVIRDE